MNAQERSDHRQAAMDLCSSLDDMDDVTEAQSFALASVVEALLYVGEQVERVATALERAM